jgi:REP element-mobilizing transposase RayT
MISCRVEEGLPFVGTCYMKLILQSILARAQKLCPVRICAFVFMGNHLHMLLIVDCPQMVVDFMDRIKTESAHATNRLLGRRKKTVWCAGYDSPPILTLDDAIEKFAYLYTNPTAANLETCIEKYPGFSSWEMLTSQEHSFTVPWIQRPMVETLTSRRMSEKEDALYCDNLRAAAKEHNTFVLYPHDWCECFQIPREERDRYHIKVIEAVRQKEQELCATRGRPVIGARALKSQEMNAPFTPKKFSPRMWCICRNIELRKSFIAGIKVLRAKARAVYQRWKEGDFSVPYPSELFAPRIPMRLAST